MKEFIKLKVKDIGIVGGKGVLKDAESNKLDTVEDKTHALYDERIKKIKLTPEWLATIKDDGIKTPPEVTQIDGVYYVVDGRERIRGHRATRDENEEIFVKVVPYVAKDAIGDMVLGNVRHDDTTSTKIAKLRRLMEHGYTIETAAAKFAIKLGTAKMWLQYDETVSKAVRAAVDAGKIPSTSGMDIARIGDHEKQDKALESVLALGKKDEDKAPKRGGAGTKAKRVIARAANPGASPGISDKKTMKRFLAAVEAQEHKGASASTLEWWSGVEATLQFVMGGDGADKRLLKILDNLDEGGENPDNDAKPEPKGDTKKAPQDKPKAPANPTEGPTDDE